MNPQDAGTSTLWGQAPCPALVADTAGGIVALNDAAAALFPGAEPGDWLEDTAPHWLSDAHQQLSGTAPTAPGGLFAHGLLGDRSFEARATHATDGEVVWWLLDDTERHVAEQTLRQERERTALLADASSVLLSSLDLQRCMEVTAQMASTHLADAALVIGPAQRRRHPVTYCCRGGPVTQARLDIEPAVLPGLVEALQGFPPVPSRWTDPAEVPDWAIPDGFTGPVGAVSITPLPGHGVPAGAIVLLRGGRTTGFSESEDVFARLFAARAGAALSAARMYAEQADITSKLMRELLPPGLRRVHGVEYAGGYRASVQTERIGGDFYDVHPGYDEDHESLAVLGDVCGKGLEAAVLTGKIRNTLQALLPLAQDHAQVLQLLNDALLASHHTRFATLVLASVLRRGSTVRLRLTSAGHPAPLVVRTDGTVEAAPTRGSLVGVLPRLTSQTATVELRPGETCLMFSDGITEARGGPLGDELFGDDRLRRTLTECAGMPAESVVERVQMLSSEWVGAGRHDDMAVLAITAPRTTHLSAVNGHTRGRFTR
ncbi:PP2C family protein-serine/threonine phosphatase [Streptomyces sp. NPDC057445]|uniref:PP2C family protein-serine/threonine phosphatase n=1 Tax=Streptomyces sp. NPDC057445 TaxID=3346136 RepID=UPI003679BBFC